MAIFIKMKTIKAIQLLKSFDTEDWREFGDFLGGQIREGHHCITLFEHIRKYRNNWNSKHLVEEYIKMLHFKEITTKSFKNIFSKLNLIIEDYFVLKEARSDRILYNLTLLKNLSSRGLFHQFEITAKKLEKELKDNNEIGVFDEFHLLELNHLRFFSDSSIKNEKGDVILEDLMQYSQRFHNQYDRLLNSVDIHLNGLSHNYKKKRKSKVPEGSGFAIMNLLYQFKKDNRIEDFRQLYNAVVNRNPGLSTELTSVTLTYLIYYGHKQFSSGDFIMADELINLYEFGFESGILLTNKVLTENRFLNAINAACASNKFDKAHEIIEKYSSKLLDASRAGTITISRAHIDFSLGNYEGTIENIRDFQFTSLSQNTRRRWLLLCAYYKEYKESFDFVDNQIKNYNSFFYNNKSKLSDSVFEGSLNLGRVIYKLIRGIDAKELQTLLTSSENIVFRSWIKKETGK